MRGKIVAFVIIMSVVYGINNQIPICDPQKLTGLKAGGEDPENPPIQIVYNNHTT